MKNKKYAAFLLAAAMVLTPAAQLAAYAEENALPLDKYSVEEYNALSDGDECVFVFCYSDDYKKNVIDARLDELVFEKTGLRKANVYEPSSAELEEELGRWTEKDEERAQNAADPEFYKLSVLKKRIEDRKRPVYEKGLAEIDMDAFCREQSIELARKVGIAEDDVIAPGVKDVLVTARITKAEAAALFQNDAILPLSLCSVQTYEERQRAVEEENKRDEEPDISPIDPSVPHEHVPCLPTIENHDLYFEHDVQYTEWDYATYCLRCGEELTREHIVETMDAPYYETDKYKETRESLEPWEKKLGEPDMDGIPFYLHELRAADDDAVFIADVWITDGYEEYAKTHPESEVEDPYSTDTDEAYSDELMNWTSEDERQLLEQLGIEKPEDNISLYENRKRDIIMTRIQSKLVDDMITRSRTNQTEYYTQAVEEAVRKLGVTDEQIVWRSTGVPMLTLRLTKPEVIEAAKNDIVTWVGFHGDDETEIDLEAADDDEIKAEWLKDTEAEHDFYDLYTDNSVHIPLPEMSVNLTYHYLEYHFHENDNGTAGCFGCYIDGVKYVKLPAIAGENIVVDIMRRALKEDASAVVVEIPNTVTLIGEEAFKGMKAVKRIYVPVSVDTIKDGAFYDLPEDCKLIVAKGSYAESYAKEHGISYAYPEDDDFDKLSVWNAQHRLEEMAVYMDGELVSEERADVDHASYPRPYKYNGGLITPEIEIRYNGRTLTQDVDYTVRYRYNDKPGTAYVFLRGIGDNTGVFNISFTIERETPEDEVNTYYFLAPEDWCMTEYGAENEDVGCYWWEPEETVRFPGVKMIPVEDHIYKVEVPKNVKTIIFNNYVEQRTGDREYEQSAPMTVTINTEGYSTGDCEYAPTLTTHDFNGWIYVLNRSRDKASAVEAVSPLCRQGEWFRLRDYKNYADYFGSYATAITGGILGDLDGDGTVTSSDALKILRMSASGESTPAADVDGDGVTTSNDALEALRESTVG